MARLRPQILAIPAYVSRDRRREILDLFAADPSARRIAEFFGPQPDPYVQNSDGHDYFDAEVTLDVPDPAETWRRLEGAFVVIEAPDSGSTWSRARCFFEGGKIGRQHAGADGPVTPARPSAAVAELGTSGRRLNPWVKIGGWLVGRSCWSRRSPNGSTT